MRLQDVCSQWALKHMGSQHLPSDLRVSSLPDGPGLPLDSSLREVLSQLARRGTGTCLFLAWPRRMEEELEMQATGAVRNKQTAKVKLNRLNVSSRYGNVDRHTMNMHKSSTYKDKLKSGCYVDTVGRFADVDRIRAMRSLTSSEDVPPAICSIELVVRKALGEHGNARDCTAPEMELFRVQLSGPEELVANWQATCDKFARLKQAGKSMIDVNQPYPVFIPTRGRSGKANLNWEAEHVFGCPAADETQLRAVVCAVVEPKEEEVYREAWPRCLFLVLPHGGRGPGYARWVVQKVCTRAFEFSVPKDRGITGVCTRRVWKERRLPWVWIVDDYVCMFYRLVALSTAGQQQHRHEGYEADKRLKKRVAAKGAPMFQEAMLAVQRHPSLPRVSVAGFLRDDGTAVCKRIEWKLDEMSLYKAVLLNLGKLRSLGVEYTPGLLKFEDVCLNHEVLSRYDRGGRTLKCQSYCFRATQCKRGGCLEQRDARPSGDRRTMVSDLMSPAWFNKLPKERQQTIRDLVHWVNRREEECAVKTTEAGAEGEGHKRKHDDKESGCHDEDPHQRHKTMRCHT